MKILLIEPAKSPITIGGEDIFIFEPLALEYIAAGIDGDHEVKILDMRLDKSLSQTLAEFDPDIVGITAYTVHVNTVKSLFSEIKQWKQEVLTVVGGHHATIMPEDFNFPSVDVIVMGEGITVFREIVRRFGKNESFEGLSGTAFRNGDGFVKNDYTRSYDLDDFPFPDRSLTEQYRNEYFSEWMKPLASIRTSKGCPFRCNFCALWKIAGGKYYKRSPEKIVEELSGIEEEYVFFADDESMVDTKRMARLAELIKEAGLKKRYFLYGRSDTIANNPELFRLWKEIGLERVFVGLEFFRDSDLDFIKKNSTTADNEKAVRILQGFGIDIYASFIVRPEYTKEDFRKFTEYNRRLKLNYASYAVLTPLPGTDYYDDVRDKLITDNYDYFDFIHTVLPTTLPYREFYKEYKRVINRSISAGDFFTFVKKFPVKDFMWLFGMMFKWNKRINKIYLDYVHLPQ